jgi:tetratricopeptide (TPR) repeat protein
MPILIPITLFGVVPVILLMFSALPPRRAATVAFIFAYLFLPNAGYSLPGIPDYSKRSALCAAVLLGTVLFRSDWLFAMRLRWFDLPMATWCLCPIASSLTNELGLYDGLSTSNEYIMTWGLPYLIGRIYFTQLEHLRELAIGVVEGGLVYVPLCMWELRMSPNLHRLVYGFDASGWGEVVFGGYRPKVFMTVGLEVAVWMTVASTTGYWLWASGSLTQIRNVPFPGLLIPLITIAVLCKVTGGWILLILGVSLWFLLKWTGSRLPIFALILIPTLYLGTRSTGIWSGDQAVSLVRTLLNERRAESLGVRLFNENQLAAKALIRPVFGWGGWARARIKNEAGKDVSLTDGMWIIALGNNGLVGLISFYSALLLPSGLLVLRYPAHALRTPTVAPVCVLATVVNLYAVDCIANAMVNPIYFLVLGGVLGVLGKVRNEETLSTNLQKNIYNNLINLKISNNAIDYNPREEAAIRLGLLGRSLLEQGRLQEAEEAWRTALQHWAGLATDYPDDLEYRKCWLDGLNDSAWSQLTLPQVEERDVSRAIRLAEQVVGLEPENATYWNTLGIAYFRLGDWKGSLRALERSIQFGSGGTSFDYFFLAMACWNQGDKGQARLWYARANNWMDAHNPKHVELLRFRAEANALIDVDRGQ